MNSSHLRKSSQWYNEKQFQKVMALNRKEESLLQQKLEQLHREERLLQREYDIKMVKTAQDLNTHKNITSTNASDETKANLSSRRNSLSWRNSLSMEPSKKVLLHRRRHSIACSPTANISITAERDNKEANNDVMFAIDNNFKFLSIAFETKPRLTSSPRSFKLPEIKPSSAQSTGTDLKPALLRRRHSDVTTLRHWVQRLNAGARRVSLANVNENFK